MGVLFICIKENRGASSWLFPYMKRDKEFSLSQAVNIHMPIAFLYKLCYNADNICRIMRSKCRGLLAVVFCEAMESKISIAKN